MFKYIFPCSDNKYFLDINTKNHLIKVSCGTNHIASYENGILTIYHPEVFNNIPLHEKIHVEHNSYIIKNLDLDFIELYKLITKIS